ncbi:MAG: cytochrome c peroxidase [Bacteriovoracaceae bacterium]
MKSKVSFFVLVFFNLALANEANEASIDEELDFYIQRFKLKPVERLKDKNRPLYKAGKILFSDTVLSGNRNISCKDCHHPAKGTSDNIALSLGEGAFDSSHDRRQGSGLVIRRHSPVLYNLGHKEFKRMFWDGRVSLTPQGLKTPEERFNGKNPQASHIVKFFDHALQAQVLFPLLSHEEMRGAPGSNALANEADNLKAWQMIFARVRKERREVFNLLTKAYPDLREEEFNIAHIATALAEFIKHEFQAWQTPYDQYLRGDRSALDSQAKRGFKLFAGKARCANCHFGKHLTNHAFMNIGAPPLKDSDHLLDRGREETSGRTRLAFAFKTPGLRNASKSAPYMHNGVFSDLEKVVRHYNNVKDSLYRYWPEEDVHAPYKKRLERLDDDEIHKEMYSFVFQPFLKKPLGLTEQEIQDLTRFLELGLTSRH